jgi:hypothetical protein
VVIADGNDMRAPIPARIHDRVCIVGFADGHRAAAPFDEDGIEMWGINRLHAVPDMAGKRFHRWFEIHSLEQFYANDTQHQQFLRDADFPIYLRPQDMGLARKWGITKAVPYPVERITSAFPPYFNNTISWLIALALAMEYQEIQLFGVDMAQDSLAQAEYSDQRPSCEFFLGLAAGRGVNIVKPEGSDLLVTSHLYGFDDGGPYMAKKRARLQELGQRKEQVRSQMRAHQDQAQALQSSINQLDGAMQELTYQLRNLSTPEAKPT